VYKLLERLRKKQQSEFGQIIVIYVTFLSLYVIVLLLSNDLFTITASGWIDFQLFD